MSDRWQGIGQVVNHRGQTVTVESTPIRKSSVVLAVCPSCEQPLEPKVKVKWGGLEPPCILSRLDAISLARLLEAAADQGEVKP